jgi:hypothetical protein
VIFEPLIAVRHPLRGFTRVAVVFHGFADSPVAIFRHPSGINSPVAYSGIPPGLTHPWLYSGIPPGLTHLWLIPASLRD